MNTQREICKCIFAAYFFLSISCLLISSRRTKCCSIEYLSLSFFFLLDQKDGGGLKIGILFLGSKESILEKKNSVITAWHNILYVSEKKTKKKSKKNIIMSIYLNQAICPKVGLKDLYPGIFLYVFN